MSDQKRNITTVYDMEGANIFLNILGVLGKYNKCVGRK